MEKHILSVMLSSRESFYLIASYINFKVYSREFQIITGFIKAYYGRDERALNVDRAVLAELIASETQNPKHTERFLAMIDEALAFDTSESNVRQVILNAKKTELGTELAMAIANGKEHEALAEEYRNILRYTSLEEMMDKGVDIYDMSHIDELMAHEVDPATRLMVYPLALNERLEGGLRGSDHLTLFARPEMGKTAIILTMACGFARQGKKGIVFNNEERIERLYMRALSCCTGMTAAEIRVNPQAAKDIADQMGFANITFIALSPGTLRQVDDFVEKSGAEWFIVDQLRNLEVKSESRTNQLEAAATGIRNIAKKHNAVAISVTQAGDSAEGKSVLSMGDVDYSNTGIPAQCDVLMGLGGTAEQVNANIRVLSLSKNKISGRHEDFPVRLNPYISKYVSFNQQ